MTTQEIIIILVLGAIAGWLAGLVFEGGGFGLIGNIIVGILGGFVGYWLLPKAHINIRTGHPWLDIVLTSAIGAGIILIVLNIVFGGRRR